jgi:hypothetical protein
MARLSYDAMRNLILDNLARLPDIGVFTPELLTAIFWEETGFQNIRQAGGGPAVGFGQVEAATIKAVNRFFKTHFTPGQILANDNDSVLITSMTLSMLFAGTRGKMAYQRLRGGFRQAREQAHTGAMDQLRKSAAGSPRIRPLARRGGRREVDLCDRRDRDQKSARDGQAEFKSGPCVSFSEEHRDLTRRSRGFAFPQDRLVTPRFLRHTSLVSAFAHVGGASPAGAMPMK